MSQTLLIVLLHVIVIAPMIYIYKKEKARLDKEGS